jgi:fucose 4-O-acetylase-like acetyltransferase
MYAYIRLSEARLVRTAGKIFIPLGQNSLYVYIVQSMLTFVLVDRALADPWVALGTNLAVVALVWLLVRYRVLFGIIPR